MASQPRTEARLPSPAGTPIRSAEPYRRDRDTSAEQQFEHAIRLATALLRAPIARLYARGPNGAVRVASSPGAASEGPGSDTAPRVASEVLRRGAAVRGLQTSTSPRRASGQRGAAAESGLPSMAACVGVPVRSQGGEVVGALVVADGPSRGWSPGDLESLGDLAALVGGALEQVGRPAPASSAHAPTVRDPSEATPPARVDPAITRARAGGSPAPGPAELFSEAGEAALVETIRQSIVGSLHLGALHTGDRLPSIRQTARAFSVTPYMVLQAYAELELEGLVERRERSGVFVADFEVGVATSLPETGAWLTEVLTQACQHQVKIPLLPDLIRRWTNAGRIRCACVESCFDSRFSLAVELSQQFGIQPTLVSAEIGMTDLRDIDLVITTAYHAAEIGPKVTEARRPMLIATVSPLILSSALNHLRERDLTVICVDPVYGERLRALQGGAYRDRVRVITTEDTAGLASLDRSEAVLLTPAARQRLAQPDFRLVAPVYPAYSLDFARKVAESLVRINLSGSRA